MLVPRSKYLSEHWEPDCCYDRDYGYSPCATGNMPEILSGRSMHAFLATVSHSSRRGDHAISPVCIAAPCERSQCHVCSKSTEVATVSSLRMPEQVATPHFHHLLLLTINFVNHNVPGIVSVRLLFKL